jgi:hypothetical protein
MIPEARDHSALIRPGYVPGQYVSAGPLPHLVDVWRSAAPSIDLLAPDIYFPNFVEWTGDYVGSGNPLFIPEVKLDSRAPREALYAIGAHDAIGFSPFAIESATDADADSLGLAYEVLSELAPVILREQGRGSMTAVIPRVSFDGTVDESPRRVTVGGSFAATVSFESPPAQPSAIRSRESISVERAVRARESTSDWSDGGAGGERGDQLVDVDGLHQMDRKSGGVAALPVVRLTVPADCDESGRRIGESGAKLAGQRVTVHSWQADVEDGDLGAKRLGQFNRVERTLRRANVVPEDVEQA